MRAKTTRAISSSLAATISVLTLIIGLLLASYVVPVLGQNMLLRTTTTTEEVPTTVQSFVTSLETTTATVQTTVNKTAYVSVVIPAIPISPCCNSSMVNASQTFQTPVTLGDFIMAVSGNITVTCVECKGGEVNASQFQGAYRYCCPNVNATVDPIVGNVSATYNFADTWIAGCTVFEIGWAVWKNTINGTLEVGFSGENFSTTAPYGSLSGSWSVTPINPASQYC
jgi:hypothetical protein